MLTSPEKISSYLLRWWPEDDKSAFLARAGCAAEQAEQLRRDIRVQLLPLDAEFLELTDYGPKYQIRGSLRVPMVLNCRSSPFG